MDWRILLLFAVFVVLLVAFGNNPVEVRVEDPKSQSYFKRSVERELTKQQTREMQGTGTLGTTGMTDVPAGATTQLGQQPSWSGMQQQQQPSVMVLQPDSISVASGGMANTDSIPSYYLADGTRIFFQGLEVFRQVQGQLRPLPDGTYTLKTGDSITIRGGQRQAPQ